MDAKESSIINKSEEIEYDEYCVKLFKNLLENGSHHKINCVFQYTNKLMEYLKFCNTEKEKKNPKYVALCCWTFVSRKTRLKRGHTIHIHYEALLNRLKKDPVREFEALAEEENWCQHGRYFAFQNNLEHFEKHDLMLMGLYHGVNHLGQLGVHEKEDFSEFLYYNDEDKEEKPKRNLGKLTPKKDPKFQKLKTDDFFGTKVKKLKESPKKSYEGRNYISED